VSRPVAYVTGVGRTKGIGAAIATGLAVDGWDIGFTYWTPFDQRMPWGADTDTVSFVGDAVTAAGGACAGIEADLSLREMPAHIFDALEDQLGPASALVIAHCECEYGSTLDTAVESFDLHYAVNVRAPWLLIREFGRRFVGRPEGGRIVTLTSDHVVGNLPYGATKAAADRITLAAAHDLAALGITANALNPGPVDTGWMDDEVREHARRQTPLERMATVDDTANMVRFLCSPQGGWVTAQLLYSNGGFTSTIN
jgi:3-oxoacyl-[acyl-carrier protein] reductase